MIFMKRHLIFLFISLLFLIPSAKAQIAIYPEKASVIVKTGGEAFLNFIVSNKGISSRLVTLSIFPSRISGLSIDVEKYSFMLRPNSNSTVRVKLYAPLEAKEFTTYIYLTASTSLGEEASSQIVVSVVRSTPVYISNVYLEKYSFNPGAVSYTHLTLPTN